MPRLLALLVLAALALTSCGTPTPQQPDPGRVDRLMVRTLIAWADYKAAADAGDEARQAQVVVEFATSLLKEGNVDFLEGVVASDEARTVASMLLERYYPDATDAVRDVLAKLLQLGISADGLDAFILMHHLGPPAPDHG